jgi:hypothetical protein
MQRNLDSKIKRQIQTDSSGNEVCAKDCDIYLEGSQGGVKKRTQGNFGLDKITNYRSDWIQHVNRTPRSRLPNLLTKYAPRGIRNQGRPLKMLLDQ